MRKVVLIGGGVGSSTFTAALKDFPIELTTIVSSFDDGGSTGALRRDYQGIALGDLRQCIAAGLELDKNLKKAVSYRFGPGHLKGVNLGNVFLRAYLDQFESEREGIRSLHRLLDLKNSVLPVSYTFARLEAELTTGGILENEDKIANYYDFGKAQFKSLRLVPEAVLNPDAKEAIISADYLIFTPGNFFTSILPHIFVRGFPEAWKSSRAEKIWMINLLAHKGQDSFYTLCNYLEWFEQRLGDRPFDQAILNRKILGQLLNLVEDRYTEIKVTAEDRVCLAKKGIECTFADLSALSVREQQPNDTIRRAPLRHDISKIRALFQKFLLNK